mmetsp:Transcript_36886/g.115467  ORF Transcript_36886/g.115467 Transcript_36886/m.115467 type:complete len:154 (-) Transcript_36886:206-667(-)
MELECPAQSLSYMALLKTEEEQSDSQQMEFRQGLSRSSFSRTFLTMTGESLRTDRQPSLGFSGTRAGKETFPRNQHWLLRSLVHHLGDLTGIHHGNVISLSNKNVDAQSVSSARRVSLHMNECPRFPCLCYNHERPIRVIADVKVRLHPLYHL